MEKDKVWFAGQKTYNIIFTEEDLQNTLIALKKQSGGFNPKDWNQFDRVKTRILFQIGTHDNKKGAKNGTKNNQ